MKQQRQQQEQQQQEQQVSDESSGTSSSDIRPASPEMDDELGQPDDTPGTDSAAAAATEADRRQYVDWDTMQKMYEFDLSIYTHRIRCLKLNCCRSLNNFRHTSVVYVEYCTNDM